MKISKILVILVVTAMLFFAIGFFWPISNNSQAQTVTQLSWEIAPLCISPPVTSTSSVLVTIYCLRGVVSSEDITIYVPSNPGDKILWLIGNNCSVASAIENSNPTSIPFFVTGSNWIAQGEDSPGATTSLNSVESSLKSTTLIVVSPGQLLQDVHNFPNGCS